MIIKEIMVSSSPCDLGPPKQNNPPIVNYHNMTVGSNYSWIKSIVDLLYPNQATSISDVINHFWKKKKNHLDDYNISIDIISLFTKCCFTVLEQVSSRQWALTQIVLSLVRARWKERSWVQEKKKCIWVSWWLTQTWTQLLLLKKPLCNTYAAWVKPLPSTRQWLHILIKQGKLQ